MNTFVDSVNKNHAIKNKAFEVATAQGQMVKARE